jgi:hypothetical protein
MGALLTWTKSWSSSDDGSIFSGSDIQAIQTNITTYCVTLGGSQTLDGDKTFSGTTTFTGSVVGVLATAQVICNDNDLMSYENEILTIS